MISIFLPLGYPSCGLRLSSLMDVRVSIVLSSGVRIPTRKGEADAHDSSSVSTLRSSDLRNLIFSGVNIHFFYCGVHFQLPS